LFLSHDAFCVSRANLISSVRGLELSAAEVRSNKGSVAFSLFHCRCPVVDDSVSNHVGTSRHSSANNEETSMKDSHNKAAEHHESAAKSHRAAADSHGKNDHAKGKEHSTQAQQHSQNARDQSKTAHEKSQQQK
jgi:hypothetical protein